MERMKGRQGPEDFAETAFRVFQEAVSETPKTESPAKNAAAVELGRLGGLKGGKARAASLSAEQRSDIARKAVQARWKRTDS